MRTTRHMVMGVAGVLTAMGLATMSFIVPNYREAASIEHQVQDLHARLATYERLVADVARLEADVRQAREDAATYLKTIPETADIAGVIRKLSDVIDGVNVVEQTFTAGSPSAAIVNVEPRPQSADAAGAKSAAMQGSTAMVMPLAAEMRATFESVMALIHKAESMPRLIRVSSVRLLCKRDDTRTDLPLLQASIGLEAVYDDPSGGKEHRR